MCDPASKQYLAKRVNPIVEKMIIDLILKRPENICDHMVQWINNQGRYIEDTNKQVTMKKQYEVESEEDDDDELQDDLLDIKQLQAIKADKQMRNSVSAEAYGFFNKKKDFKPKFVPKNKEQIKRIKDRMHHVFMFNVLDEKDKNILVDAMEEKSYNKGAVVIHQGDVGECMYLIDKGSLDCFKKKGDGEDNRIKSYQPGEAFGELALLHNAPRAATIIAQTDCTLFSLDRETFNHIVKEAAMNKRKKYKEFIQKVELLSEMSDYEQEQLADAVRFRRFKKGDYIIREGDFGDEFFMLDQGNCVAQKVLESGKDPVTVMSYNPGDYFGEIALLKNQPRGASILAKNDVTVAYITKNVFKRLIGPLEDILKRNFQKYEKYL